MTRRRGVCCPPHSYRALERPESQTQGGPLPLRTETAQGRGDTQCPCCITQRQQGQAAAPGGIARRNRGVWGRGTREGTWATCRMSPLRRHQVRRACELPKYCVTVLVGLFRYTEAIAAAL